MTPPGSAKPRESKTPAAKTSAGKTVDETDASLDEILAPEYRRRRWRSWRMMLGMSSLVAVGIVALAPWILTQCGGIQRLLRAAPIPGSLSIGSVSLAWWSPVTIDDVELRDPHGELIAKIDRITSDKTLFALAMTHTDLGRVVAQHPRLLVVTRDGGSNVEDYLNAIHWPAGNGGSTALFKVELDVTEGETMIEDSLTKRQVLLSGIAVSLMSSSASQGSLDATLSAKVATDTQAGSITGELHAAAAGPTAGQPSAPFAKASLDERGDFARRRGDAETSEQSGGETLNASTPSEAAPSDTAPGDTAPSDAAPSDGAPSDTATSDAAPADAPAPVEPVEPEPASEMSAIAAASGSAPPISASAGSPLATGRAQLHVTGIPLAALQPLLRRVLPNAQIDGQLVAKFSGSWGDGADHQSQSLDADLLASNLVVSAPSLGAEKLQLAQIHLPCKLTHSAGAISVEQLALTCDVGQASASGQLQLASIDSRELLSTLANQSFQIGGQLDVAKLAKLLPATLRIRDGVDITAGQIAISASGVPSQGQTAGTWQARLEGSNLAAVNNGQQITWQEPLVVQINGHDDPQGPMIDSAKVDSTFLHAQASGAANNLSGNASFDLAKLAAEAAQFVNLGAMQLGGSGDVNFAWQQAADRTFALRANINAKDMQIALPNRPAWVEPALTSQIDVRGLMAGPTPQRLDRASLEIIGNQERLAIELAQPASDVDNVAFNVTWQGPVNGWTGRLALWFDIAGWELTGEGSLIGQVILANNQIAFQQLSLKADRVHAWLPGLYFDEQHLEITGGAVWDGAQQTLQVPDLVVSSAQVGARLTNLQTSIGKDGAASTTGELAYKAELGQLIRWTRDPRQASDWNITGQASGNGRLALAADVSSIAVAATVDNLQVAPAARAQDATGRPIQNVSRSQPIAWREQQMTLALNVAYDHAHDQLTISQAEVAAAALGASVVGTIAALNTQRVFDLKGDLQYDWSQLAPLLQPYLGARVSIAGQEKRPFNLQGSWPVGEASPAAQWQQLTGGGGIGWTGANVYGLPIGPGQLACVLSRGIVQFQPLDLSVSDGTLHINEQWRILPAPGELRMAKGKLIEHVQVTPEVRKQALQYAAPILADVTQVEGTFSVDIEGGKLTLGSAAGCDVVGHLLTDQAHVQAGPLAQQFALLARRIEQLLLAQSATPDEAAAVLVNLNNESVDFRVVGGRVYHRNLKFKIGALQVVTQGSVGFDESLEMLAEVAIEESLIANRPLLRQLLGHPLQIPLTGTLGAPQLDMRGVEDLTRQMARNAAKDIITKPLEAVEKPLENLFRQ